MNENSVGASQLGKILVKTRKAASMASVEASSASDTKCADYARLGEFHCAARDYHTGLRYYEAAIHCGTSNTALFAAICSQAGAAAFFAGENDKALLYFKQDFKLCR